MLVSAHWLKKNIKKKNIKVVDASWYLPSVNRDPKKEYLSKRLPKSVFFDIDDIELIVLENILKSDSYLFDLKFLLRR